MPTSSTSILCKCSLSRRYLLPHRLSALGEPEICRSFTDGQPPQEHQAPAEHFCRWACLGVLPLGKPALPSGLRFIIFHEMENSQCNTHSTMMPLALHNRSQVTHQALLSKLIHSSTLSYTDVLPALQSSSLLGPQPAPILCLPCPGEPQTRQALTIHTNTFSNTSEKCSGAFRLKYF